MAQAAAIGSFSRSCPLNNTLKLNGVNGQSSAIVIDAAAVGPFNWSSQVHQGPAR